MNRQDRSRSFSARQERRRVCTSQTCLHGSSWQRSSYSRLLRVEKLEDRRLLANVSVTNFNDVVNGNVTSIAALVANTGGDGISLREAVLAANADAAADTLSFFLLLPGSIQLTNVGHPGEIAITNDLTINGPGGNALTIRGFAGTAAARDGARIFNVNDDNLATFKNVSINGLVLTGGDENGSGGAIRNATENLTISNSTISNNSAISGGGLQNNGGHLTVSGCTINANTALGNGAGIETLGGSLSVVKSTVSGNSTPAGGASGGIHSSSSTATIDSSTISGNSANYGGGITHSGVGILMTITNSTISGNSARINGGGVSVVQGDLVVRHSTITGNRADSDGNGTGNGGGLFVAYNPSNVTIDHTIVAGNLRQASAHSDVFGAATVRYSLLGDNTGATITDNGGNLVGTSASPVDPLLGPLADNGDLIFTHALMAGSPAIDAGDPAAVAGAGNVPLNDQRGELFTRVFDGDGVGGARIDIGAVERQAAPVALVVSTLVDENDAIYSSGDLSLREAIILANGSAGANVITFASTLTSGGLATILLTLGDLKIANSLSIDGPGGHLLNIDASGNDPTPEMRNSDGTRVLTINDGSTATMSEVTLSGLTLTGGDVRNFGGALFNAENLTLAESTISGNSAGFEEEFYFPTFYDHGGGIFNHGNMTISNSTINGNYARYLGGGIENDSNLTIVNSTITGNFAGREFAQMPAGVEAYGGGIFNSGYLSVLHSTITANNASTFPASLGSGEGIFSNGSMVLDHTIVAGNDPFNVDATNVADNGSTITTFSLIGGSVGLGPLADNGGSTFTHALFPGSPAIDAGDPNFDPNNPDGDSLTDDAVLFDQRGAPFVRVAGGRIDIGAYERQSLAGRDLIVDTIADEDNGDFSPGDLSLREAIDLANGGVGADTITFASALSGATISLNGTELVISDELVIDARLLATNVTIDAHHLSRIFDITATTGDITFGGLTLTGGSTDGGGGAIISFTSGNLTLVQSTVSGNRTTGFGAYGGAVRAYGTVTITQSTVSGNSTTGDEADGGGISLGSIFHGVNLIQSTVSGNSTAGNNAVGGGVHSRGPVTLTQSTVSGNSTAGDNADGGGIWVLDDVTLIQSTVTDNHVLHSSSMGGGVYQGNLGNNFPFTIFGSIVAGNTAPAGGPDVVPDPQSTLNVNYSLIGVADLLTLAGNVGNRTGSTNNPLDPQLGPLANNGGPTKTHALLPISPAIDAGDSTFDPADPDGDPMTDDALSYDQRGEPFIRVFDGDGVGDARIDMGAFELINSDALSALFGDYNRNGVVDAADYTTWRDTLGQTSLAPYRGADGSGDGTIGPEDYQVWKSHFGQMLQQLGAGSAAPIASAAATTISSLIADAHSAIRDGGFYVTGRSRPPVTVSLQKTPSDGLFEVLRRPTSIPRLSSKANMDAGLLAWLAARNDSRRIDHNTPGESSLADQTGKTESDTRLDLVDGVFGLRLADIAAESLR